MGVNADDEVELLHGYFCTGFKPYSSLAPAVCDDINAAAVPNISASEVKIKLLSAYDAINRSGKIVPLYHFPRRFLVNKRWDLDKYNRLLPFPIFTSFRLAGGGR